MKAKCCDRCAKLYLDEELKSELILMRETGKKYGYLTLSVVLDKHTTSL